MATTHISNLIVDTMEKSFEHCISIVTQVNRMCRSRRVLATGGKQTEYGWTGSVFIHFYFL